MLLLEMQTGADFDGYYKTHPRTRTLILKFVPASNPPNPQWVRVEKSPLDSGNPMDIHSIKKSIFLKSEKY